MLIFGGARFRRGLTFIELLVAVTISLIFAGSVAMAFIQIMRASDQAEAIVRAHTRGRAAVDQIAQDLKFLQLDPNPAFQFVLLESNPLPYGNRIDLDGDGSVDEEVFDGTDTDGDWQAVSDVHAQVGGLFERADFVGVPDYGDFNVDEDPRFSNDRLSFIVPPGAAGPGSPRQLVTYFIGTFDGFDNVLIRRVHENPPSVDAPGPFTDIPVIFDVVSLDILAWDPNRYDVDGFPGVTNPRPAGFEDVPYWVTDWDSRTKTFPQISVIGAPFGVPPFRIPASFLIRVTVSAERVPLEEVAGGVAGNQPLQTVSISTVINVERTIKDIRYDLYVRRRNI